METQNPVKNRLSSMIRTSFGSCKSKTMTDAISPPKPKKHYQLYQLFSPKPNTPFPPSSSTTHKPKKCSENPQKTQLFPLVRPKVSDRKSLLAPTRTRITPESQPPISPVDTFIDIDKPKKKSKNKRRNKKRVQGLKRNGFESFDSYYDWFSTDEDEEDDDDDKTTLFSSKSLSSDSSGSFRRKTKPVSRRKRAPKKENHEVGSGRKLEAGKVKESCCFVVEKRSSDPYDDFTTSMVEMIVEKQIFGARDLEDLLETFLSLNSYHHHRVIVEVFTEICDALFSNWS